MPKIRKQQAAPADFEAVTDGHGSLSRNLFAVALPIAVALSALVYLISRSASISLLVGALVFAASAYSNFKFFGDVARRRATVSDAEAVEVIEVQATRVLDVEPHGSHEPAWVFFSDDGQALLLIGQWLREQPSFPSLSFSLMRWADSKKPIRIDSNGPEIEPEPSNARLPVSPRLSDVEVFPATPDSLQVDLDAAFPPAPARA